MSSGTIVSGSRDALQVTRKEIDLDRLEDGTVVTAEEDGQTYLARAGRLIPAQSPAQVLAAGFDPGRTPRVTLPVSPLLRTHEQSSAHGPVVATLDAPASKNFDSGDVFLGSGHYMRTWGGLYSDGRVAAQTRIRTVTWFGGYHGGASVIAADTNDNPVYSSANHRFGVDGTAIGTSDRTEAWYESMDPNRWGDVHKIYIFQSWQPDSFQTILDKWVAAGQSVATLAGSVASIAKVVATFV